MLRLINSIAYLMLAGTLCVLLAATAKSQQFVDETVATVSDGVKTELITYSDLMWQLALVPGIPLSPPSSEDLNRALQLVIRQRLIKLEAERIPRNIAATDEEIKKEIELTLRSFPSTEDFRQRLNTVGFKSIEDENFRDLIEQRVLIQKYIDFRFRSFVVITEEEEKRYYNEVFTPEFRRENPDRILPTFEEKRDEINRILTREQVAEDIDRFIDNAESRAEIVILKQV